MEYSEGADTEDNRGVREESDNKQGPVGFGNKQDIPYYKTLELDNWQKDVLTYDGNIVLRAGRQIGKSTVIAMKAAQYALKHDSCSVLIISATERQAYLLFMKVYKYIEENMSYMIRWGKDKPTKTEIKLLNDSVIRCLPTGVSGIGIRGFTVDLLIGEEAAFIPQEVWAAVTPMIVTTGGKIILLSTPFGKKGYFYDCFFDPHFKSWHITTEEVAEKRKEPMRTLMREYLEREKKRMTRLQYAQEYLGEFVDDLKQLFSDDLVKRSCVLRRRDAFRSNADYFLGVDIARLGDDEGTYEVVEKIDKEYFEHVDNIVTVKKLTTETFDKILALERRYKFNRIGIDAGSGSLGVGILDFLLREPELKRKVVALNNLTRGLDHLGERKRQLLKEDMYMNLLVLLERGFLKLLNDDEVIASLRSVQYEYYIVEGKKSEIRIYGNYTHIAEGLIRAVWLANQKSLNSFIDYI